MTFANNGRQSHLPSPTKPYLSTKKHQKIMKKAIITGEFSIMEVTAAGHGPSKARQRIEALKKAGIDTSSYLTLGDDTVLRVTDGSAAVVTDDDPVFRAIGEGGYISHYRLFRRWVMAQMFRMLRACEGGRSNLTQEIQRHGYEYSWRMLRDELHAQERMAAHADAECFKERNAWFNGRTAHAMALHYTDVLRGRVSELTVRKCKGRPYVTIHGEHVFTDELWQKVYEPLDRAAAAIARASTPEALAHSVAAFDRLRKPLPPHAKMCKEFIQAYKGAGAYFTCKNLILFHGARFAGTTEKESVAMLTRCAAAHSAAGYGHRSIGLMKQLIAESGISVSGKLAGWR